MFRAPPPIVEATPVIIVLSEPPQITPKEVDTVLFRPPPITPKNDSTVFPVPPPITPQGHNTVFFEGSPGRFVPPPPAMTAPHIPSATELPEKPPIRFGTLVPLPSGSIRNARMPPTLICSGW